MKQREVGGGRDQASSENDLQAADLVGEPSEEDEERHADRERRPHQEIGGQIIEMQRYRQKEECVELRRVPDHTLARRCTE